MPGQIPGLSHADSALYRAALSAPGARTRLRVRVLDLDHKPLGQLDGVLDGQVRWSRSDPVTTQGTIMQSDFDDLADLDLRHLLQPQMGVDVEEGARTLWCPVMTGWVVRPRDTGNEAEFGIHDKMAMGLTPSRRGKAGANDRVGQVIHDMFEQIGETHFNIPRSLREGGPKVGDRVHWGGEDDKAITLMARRLAKRADLQVFYDQRGRLTVRRPPRAVAVSWTEDDEDELPDARLLEPMTWDRDLTAIRNQIIGAGKHKLDPSWATAGNAYDYSPHRLVRGGVPMRLTYRYADSTIDKQSELNQSTAATLRRMSTERVDVRLSSTPTPWLSGPWDLLRARKRNGRVARFHLVTGSMELDGSSMEVGWQRVLDRARARGRRRGHHGRGHRG